MAKQNVPVQVLTVASDEATSSPSGAPSGWILSVQPRVSAAVNVRGIFLEVFVLQGNTVADANIVGTIWRGYVDSGRVPASAPNFPVDSGMYVAARAYATSSSGAIRVDVAVSVESDPKREPLGQGFVFNEEPGSGRGFMRAISLAAPAAGAEFATQTVPARALWVAHASYGELTTSVAVANRVLRTEFNDPTAGTMAMMTPDFNQTAATVGVYSGSRNATALRAGYANAAVVQLYPLPEVRLRAAQRVIYGTSGLQAADQWANGRLVVEEWAVP